MCQSCRCSISTDNLWEYRVLVWKCQLWHITDWQRQQKEAVTAHSSTVSVMLMYQSSLSVSVSFFYSKARHVCHFTQMSVFQRVSGLLLRHSNTAKSSIPCTAKQAPMCAYKHEIHTETLQQYMNAHCRGCLVDCHYRTLHSKCTFSWRTSNVFFSSHCLAQNCS